MQLNLDESLEAMSAYDVRLSLVFETAADTAEMLTSFAISAGESAFRGSSALLSIHARQVGACAAELMKSAIEAVELEKGATNG